LFPLTRLTLNFILDPRNFVDLVKNVEHIFVFATSAKDMGSSACVKGLMDRGNNSMNTLMIVREFAMYSLEKRLYIQ
jgi:hypothetical protein